jgi:hypothetical protein
MKLARPTESPNQHPIVVENISVQKIFFFNSGVRIGSVPKTRGNSSNGIFCCRKNVASPVSEEITNPIIIGMYNAANKNNLRELPFEMENFFPIPNSQ